MQIGDRTRARVRRQIRAYFDECDKRKRRYTLSGLKVAVNAAEKDWEELRGDRRLGPELELAMERIRDSLEQRGDSMAVMLRKELAQAVKPEGRSISVGFEGSMEDYGG